MIRKLFRTRKIDKSACPTFRPMLEALETREVPTTGITNPIVQNVEAALQEIPPTLQNFQLNINTNNSSNGFANEKVIANDLNVLNANASLFASSSRLQIDITQVQSGVQLYQDGILLSQLGSTNLGNSLRSNVALPAIFNGLTDYLNMQSGLSNGNLTLS